VLQGGRGKAGLIHIVQQDRARQEVRKLLTTTCQGEKVYAVLAEELLEINKEHYLSISVDRNRNDFQLIYSAHGGIDIESQKKMLVINVLTAAQLKRAKLPANIKPIALKLFRLFVQKEALLAEINPLIETPKGFVAADSKIVIDDNAIYRHPDLQKYQRIPKAEKDLRKLGAHYIPLGGDIAVIGNGAGLVMATLDTLKMKGLEPADFLDVGGSASMKALKQSMETLLQQKPKAFFINIFAGLTHADDMARGIVEIKRKHKLRMPIVVRMIGTNERKAKTLLEAAGIHPARSLDEGIRQLVKVLK